MELSTLFLSLAVIFGFFMAWGIGANDVSNAMGTSVGSKAITIRQAIVIAAIFEFLGAFLAGSEVTDTIKQDIIDPTLFTHQAHFVYGMLASLLAAGMWLIIASFFGWPVSTTHTIVGAIIGFGVSEIGFAGIKWATVLSIISGWVLSPFLGGIISYSLFISTQKLIFNKSNPIVAAKRVVPYYIFLASWVVGMITFSKLSHLNIELNYLQTLICATIFSLLLAWCGRFFIQRLKLKPEADKHFHFTNVERIFSVLMVFTACAMAFAHGSNDVANAIGPVAAVVNHVTDPDASSVPIWVLFMGAGGIVVGLTMYGHKVIATVGNRITQLTPSRGFSATLAAATTVVVASGTGLPISTTHTLVGGILGVGLARGIQALNLNVIRNIFMSWVVTLPAGALLAIVFFNLFRMIFENL